MDFARLIPIDRDVYLTLFAAYNEALWPGQVIALAAGIVVMLAALTPSDERSRAIAAVLAVFWALAGGGFEIGQHAIFDVGAWGLGFICLIQSGMLLWAGVIGRRLRFRLSGPGMYPAILLAIAAAALPSAMVLVAGRRLAETQPFGLAPLPVALFTLALLWAAAPRAARRFLAVPVILGTFYGATALTFGVYEDAVLPALVLAAAALLFRRRGV